MKKLLTLGAVSVLSLSVNTVSFANDACDDQCVQERLAKVILKDKFLQIGASGKEMDKLLMQLPKEDLVLVLGLMKKTGFSDVNMKHKDGTPITASDIKLSSKNEARARNVMEAMFGVSPEVLLDFSNMGDALKSKDHALAKIRAQAINGVLDTVTLESVKHYNCAANTPKDLTYLQCVKAKVLLLEDTVLDSAKARISNAADKK